MSAARMGLSLGVGVTAKRTQNGIRCAVVHGVAPATLLKRDDAPSGLVAIRSCPRAGSRRANLSGYFNREGDMAR